MMMVLLQVGHALYEQGRPTEYLDLPVSRALSMGVHESQSLFWERWVWKGGGGRWPWCNDADGSSHGGLLGRLLSLIPGPAASILYS